MVQEIQRFLTGKLPVFWRRVTARDRHCKRLDGENVNQTIEERLTVTWNSREDWMIRNKDIVHDLRDTYFSDDIQDIPMSDPSEAETSDDEIV